MLSDASKPEVSGHVSKKAVENDRTEFERVDETAGDEVAGDAHTSCSLDATASHEMESVAKVDSTTAVDGQVEQDRNKVLSDFSVM